MADESVAQQPVAQQPVTEHRPWLQPERLATWATYGVLALTMADNTMVGVAVPNIRDDFRAGVTSLEWVVAGYIVAYDTQLVWRFPNPRMEELMPLESMGETGENVAERWQVSRDDSTWVDDLAVRYRRVRS